MVDKQGDPPPLPETTIRLIAALAKADVRTVRRHLNGEKVKGAALRERIVEAVAKVRSEQESSDARP